NWWVPINNSAEYLALAYLERESVWIMPDPIFRELAQQKNEKKFQFFMSTTPNRERRDGKRIQMKDFDEFRIENQVQWL
ncbi:MAG: hypothetical protein ACQKBW_07795, partial [Puniceicoccales bacterium]